MVRMFRKYILNEQFMVYFHPIIQKKNTTNYHSFLVDKSP